MCNNESVTSTLLALSSALVLWSSSSSSLFFSCVLLLLKHVSVNKEAHEDCICYSTAKSMLHIAGRERKRGRKWTICCLGLFFLLEFLGNRRGIHILNSLLPMPRAMSIRLDLTANRIQRTLDISHAHLFKYHTVSSFSSLSCRFKFNYFSKITLKQKSHFLRYGQQTWYFFLPTYRLHLIFITISSLLLEF